MISLKELDVMSATDIYFQISILSDKQLIKLYTDICEEDSIVRYEIVKKKSIPIFGCKYPKLKQLVAMEMDRRNV